MYPGPSPGRASASALLRAIETWGGSAEPSLAHLLAALDGRVERGRATAFEPSAVPEPLVQQLLDRLPRLDRAGLRSLLSEAWEADPAHEGLLTGPLDEALPESPAPPSPARQRLNGLVGGAGSNQDAPPPLSRLIARARDVFAEATLPEPVLDVWAQGLERALSREDDAGAPWRKSAQALEAARQAIAGRRHDPPTGNGADLRSALQDPLATPAELLELRARLALTEPTS